MCLCLGRNFPKAVSCACLRAPSDKERPVFGLLVPNDLKYLVVRQYSRLFLPVLECILCEQGINFSLISVSDLSIHDILFMFILLSQNHM